MTEAKRVGVLTGGGDAPGLNPAIKGLVYRGSELGLEVVGLFDGWRSLLNPLPDTMPLDRETVRRWDRDGGTNLGSSRTNPFKGEGSTDRSHEVLENIERLKLDALVACGGEDTLGVAAGLAQKGVRLGQREAAGLLVPKHRAPPVVACRTAFAQRDGDASDAEIARDLPGGGAVMIASMLT